MACSTVFLCFLEDDELEPCLSGVVGQPAGRTGSLAALTFSTFYEKEQCSFYKHCGRVSLVPSLVTHSLSFV